MSFLFKIKKYISAKRGVLLPFINNKRKVFLDYPPHWITIGITNACRNSCVFCPYHSEDAREESKVFNIPFTMDMTCFKKIVDMAKESGVPAVHICAAGEPFMNRDVLQMIDYCIEVYGQASIQTCFDQVLFEKFQYLDEIIARRNNIRYITTDILSGDPQHHNAIKLGSSYDNTMNCLERISNESDIKIQITWVLTKLNYTTLINWLHDAINRKLRNVSVNLVNVFPFNFNNFTSPEVLYTVNDIDIMKTLKTVKAYGKQYQIKINIPPPVGSNKLRCNVFWQKFQIRPVKSSAPDRYYENTIPNACHAVVKGNLNSLGHLFDYKTIMDFWNNAKLLSIRQNLINGIYPDKECKYCYLCQSDDAVHRQK